MKTIIAGTRTCENIALLEEAISECGWEITEVISGTARGADRLGEIYATRNQLPCVKFPANWDLYGKSAGYKRNVEMAEYGEALIALWDGKSRGTMHMINIARSKGLKVYVKFI